MRLRKSRPHRRTITAQAGCDRTLPCLPFHSSLLYTDSCNVIDLWIIYRVKQTEKRRVTDKKSIFVPNVLQLLAKGPHSELLCNGKLCLSHTRNVRRPPCTQEHPWSFLGNHRAEAMPETGIGSRAEPRKTIYNRVSMVNENKDEYVEPTEKP